MCIRDRIEEIETIRSKKAPVLVGTASVESSEIVSSLLTKKGIQHQVLNAKQHAKEAEIIANAGVPGAVTIATNMAGRGTDIVLGGKTEGEKDSSWVSQNQTVLDAGGLHILGTERHESRRIDNQLRGRAGRQGDPGYSKFFLSLEDDFCLFNTSPRHRAGARQGARLGRGRRELAGVGRCARRRRERPCEVCVDAPDLENMLLPLRRR